jgi:selenocysteine lyase/cysteine desulfurase
MQVADRFDVQPGYLNTASIGAPPRGACLELREQLSRWAEGRAEARDYDAWVARARSAFARMVSVPAEQVAIGSAVSVFGGVVAASLPPRSQVLACRDDFTSVLFPLLAHDHDVRFLELDELAEAVTADTALVAVSAVQSADGRVADLDAIEAAAAAHGTLTYLDATQAVGWLPLDASRFDFFSCAAYKWLLAPRGAAFMVVRPERVSRIRPGAAGWYAGEDPWASLYGQPLRLAAGARRLDLSPAWLSWVGAAPALELLNDIGIDAIHEHDVRLANRLRTGLGMPESSSAIVSLDTPRASERLARAGIRAAVRAGGLRASFHLYNTDADVDRALEALARPG